MTNGQKASLRHYIAYWKERVPDPDAPLGRRIVHGGSHDLGKKVHHGQGLTSFSAAKKRWAEIAREIISGSEKPTPVKPPVVTFESYTKDVWMPSRSSRWTETTEYITDSYYFQSKLFPKFGATPMEKIGDAAMQNYLNELRDKGYSRTVIKHCRTYLRAVMRHAKANGVIKRDPSFDLVIPRGIKKEKRPYLPMTDFEAILKKLARRDRLMAKLLYIGALRRGELFALRWKDWNGESMLVDSQINRFYKETPVKTESSEAYVPLPKEIADEIQSYKEWCDYTEPDDLIFPSKRRTPISPKNWIDRVLIPAAAKAGIPHINYHMFRRGIATEMHQDKIADKNIQSQLRHARMSTTQDLYTQAVPVEHRDSVERFYKGKKQKT
jgi:integrase